MLLEYAKIFERCVFITPEKDSVMLHYREVEDGPILDIVLPIDTQDPDFLKILEHFNFDEIQKQTTEFIKVQRQKYLEDVKYLAQDEGLLYDAHGPNKNGFRPALSMFDEPITEDDQEWLFDLKLAVFDLDKVSESTDNELKKRLRQATTPAETLYIAGKFLYE